MKETTNPYPHIPVMLNECLEFFSDSTLCVFFDGTLGAGGHAEGILKAHPEIRLYIGCDQDPRAFQIARQRLEPWKEKMRYVQGNFSALDKFLREEKINEVQGFFLI